MYIAILKSEELHLVSLGKTEFEAKDALVEGWNRNQQQLVQNGWKNRPDFYSSAKVLEEEYEVSVHKINAGESFSLDA